MSEFEIVGNSELKFYIIVARGGLPDALVGYTSLDHSWELLGMTPSAFEPGKPTNAVLLVYIANIRG